MGGVMMGAAECSCNPHVCEHPGEPQCRRMGIQQDKKINNMIANIKRANTFSLVDNSVADALTFLLERAR
jgi:hypothetical protein